MRAHDQGLGAREDAGGPGVGQGNELELTLIGTVAVLTGAAPDELELQAALAYAAVKWRRRHLLQKLAEGEAEHPVLLVTARRRKAARARRGR